MNNAILSAFIGLLLAYTSVLGQLLAAETPSGPAQGDVDLSFDPGTGANNTVYAVAIQSDGKVLIGGVFTAVSSVSRSFIARLNPDGSLDAGFNPSLNGAAVSFAIDADGKIIIGGYFTLVNGASRSGVARLNANGSLDTSFNPGNGTSHEVYSVAVQPDGKVLIGGYFSQVDGIGRNRIARLNVDGSLDTTFDPGTGANNEIDCVVLQPDGKVLIGGYFTFVDGVARFRLARLNSDGSLDAGFNGGANHGILSIVPQPDGRIVIAGPFSTVNAVNRSRIARLNPDGSLDASFLDRPISDTVSSVALQGDGKLVIGGAFGLVSGATRRFVTRLNANGTLDSSFDTGTGAESVVLAVALQSDGKVLIGGMFLSVNGVARSRIARLHTSCSASPVPDFADLPALTGECSVTIDTAPTATAGCAGTIIGTTTDPLTYTAQGTYAVAWHYNDGRGNETTQAQTVIVKDMTPPVPDRVMLPTVTGPCVATIVNLPTATDNCAGTITGTTADLLTYTALGTYTIHWTYFDGHGNNSSQTQTVVVQDTIAPQIACPADGLVGCAVDMLVPVTFNASATDNCDSAPTVTCTPPSGWLFPIGTTLVICAARDAAGNESSCSFNVTRASLEFTGFLAPVGGADATGGSFEGPLRTFKKGSTIPVQFTATCDGSPVASGVHRLQVIKHTEATTFGDPIDAAPQGSASTGDQFTFSDGVWAFKLDTRATGMSTGIWLFRATLSDGSQHTAWVQLK